MVVGITVAEMHLPASRSLKQKRKVIKSLIERLHHRYRISIAETDFHDLHQRAEISMAIVSRREHEIEQMFDAIRRTIDEVGPELVLTRWDPQYLEAGES